MDMVMETSISSDGCPAKARCYTLEPCTSKFLLRKLGAFERVPPGV